MTISKQRKFTFNSLLENIRGSKCCVIKVRQYICIIDGFEFNYVTILQSDVSLKSDITHFVI